MNITLIVVLAILILNALAGYKKGLIRMVLSMVAMIIAVIVVSIVTPSLKDYMAENTSFDDSIRDKTQEYFDDKEVFDKSEDTIIASLPLPEELKDCLDKHSDKSEYTELGYKNVNDYVVGYVSDIIFTIIIYILSFIVIYIGISVLFRVLNVISHLPGIHMINKTAGLIAGLVHGLLTIWIAFIILTIFANGSFAGSVFEQINDSGILTFLYSNNLLMELILYFIV